MKKDDWNQLGQLCAQFRRDVLTTLHARQTGHPGGSLSVCEILTSLYFCEMNVTPENIRSPQRDRLVLCKGHAAPMLYRVLAEKGFFPVGEMATLREINSRLQGHPCALSTPGVELTSGPLGLGLSAAVGMSLALKLDQSPARVYAVIGDGETNEGTIWEACMSAAKFQADNLLAILDWNHVQLDGTTDEIMPTGDFAEKFKAFGWHVICADGHDIASLCEAYREARTVTGKPSVVLARTVKGKGVSFMEGKSAWHGKAIGAEEYSVAIKELGGVS